jgi:hypothetical protein
MRVTKWLVFNVALVAAVGCSRDSVGPGLDGMGADDAASIAIDTDEITGDIILAQLDVGGFEAGLAVDGITRPFSRSHECQAGGTVTVNGEIERTQSGDGVVEWTLVADGAWNDCARARGDRKLTIDGEFTLNAYRKRVNGEFVGPQTTTKSGHFTWTRGNGDTGECDLNLTSVRQPDARTIHITGTVCGREIDRTVEWRSGRG